jgi:2,3-diketo-5-methylthio-1-phosphopentane phosphatase
MPHVLVSDFDGTMTENDFYKLAAERLLPPEVLAFWAEYRAGRMTHFEALRGIFGRIRVPEESVHAVVDDMGPDPFLTRDVARLRDAGWRVVVASAGCRWYIDRVLKQAGLDSGPGGDVEVHANPGVYAPDTGLVMRLPTESPFCCLETGVDKAAIVRHFLDQGLCVAFAGDGFADLEAALLVRPALRFARADLARALAERGEAARPFSRWSEVASALADSGAQA